MTGNPQSIPKITEMQCLYRDARKRRLQLKIWTARSRWCKPFFFYYEVEIGLITQEMFTSVDKRWMLELVNKDKDEGEGGLINNY